MAIGLGSSYYEPGGGEYKKMERLPPDQILTWTDIKIPGSESWGMSVLADQDGRVVQKIIDAGGIYRWCRKDSEDFVTLEQAKAAVDLAERVLKQKWKR